MKKSKEGGISGKSSQRNASEPFTIHLKDGPYTLTRESLWEQVNASLPRKRKWPFPHLKFISFEDSCLKLLNTWNGISFETTIGIEADKLHVSCNCGSAVDTLCLHAYRALEHLTGYIYRNPLGQYAPKGLFETATAHKKYFNIKASSTGLDITPKYYLGTVYPLFTDVGDANLPTILRLPGDPAPKKDETHDKGLAYILAYSSQNEYLPFLIPCVGSLNKDRTMIKSFHHFVNEPDKGSELFLTEDQENLNKICFEMLKEAENLSGESLNSTEPLQVSSLQTLFNLWKEAIPLVMRQDFVYIYYLYYIKELKGRPARNRIRKVNIRGEVPRLHFKLRKKTSFYQLHMNASIRGEYLKNIEWHPAFFITQWQDVYMLSSLRDSGVVKWMSDSDNCISVFEEHFDDFSKDILQPLQKDYPVETGPDINNQSI